MSEENKELRLMAQRSIKNYMHYELYELIGGPEMMPFFDQQADVLMKAVDNAISAVKEHPLATKIKKAPKS